MPTCFLETSAPKNVEAEKAFCIAASAKSAEMTNKPEAYVMTKATSGVTMTFAGSFDPCANIRICCIGMDQGVHNNFAAEMTALVTEHFGVPGDRVFIEFKAPQGADYAHNGNTFA